MKRSVVLGAIALASLTAAVHAQSYPSKPVHIIVGFSSGAATDAVARLLAQKFTDSWGTQVVEIGRAHV